MADDHNHDRVAEILGQAVWVFAGLGITQIVVAYLTHKVALGADGAHNLLEFLILGISRWAHQQEGAGPKNFWNCRVSPRGPEITSYGTIVAAIFFLYFGWGEATRGGSWLAFVLVTISFIVNGVYALKMHEHKDESINASASWRHLLADTFAAGIAAIGYVAIGLGAWLILDPITAIAGVAAVILAHIGPIRKGRADAKRHRDPNHTHESSSA